jgi:hypothetical protein
LVKWTDVVQRSMTQDPKINGDVLWVCVPVLPKQSAPWALVHAALSPIASTMCFGSCSRCRCENSSQQGFPASQLAVLWGCWETNTSRIRHH